MSFKNLGTIAVIRPHEVNSVIRQHEVNPVTILIRPDPDQIIKVKVSIVGKG